MASNQIYGPGTGAQLPATLVNAGTTELPVLNPLNSNNALFVAIPANSRLERRVFSVEASGALTTTAASTATLKLYVVPAATIQAQTTKTLANSTAIGSSGAVTQNSSRAPWMLRATGCVYDSVSGKLTGKVEFIVNNTLVAAAAFSTVITTVNGQSDPVIGFLITETPSAATHTLEVDAFEIQF